MTMPSLDVLVALITIYIVLALTVSAATEVLTRIVGLRSIGLRSGIRSILQDPSLGIFKEQAATRAFWASGIIKSATDGDSRPTSLDALTFATATLSALKTSVSTNDGTGKPASILSGNEHLQSVLDDLAERAIHRGTSLHDELAQHFDATMEKMARWYRHWTQFIAFALAAVFTVYVNANSLDLLHQLTAHPEARLELAKVQLALNADQRAETQARSTTSSASAPTSTASTPPASGRSTADQLTDAYEIITKDSLGGGFKWPDTADARWHVLLGLLMTILAVSLGAPFWFDVLGRITQKPTGTNQPASSVSPQPVPAVPAPAAPSASAPESAPLPSGGETAAFLQTQLTAPPSGPSI
jgi:hypothetical protein